MAWRGWRAGVWRGIDGAAAAEQHRGRRPVRLPRPAARPARMRGARMRRGPGRMAHRAQRAAGSARQAALLGAPGPLSALRARARAAAREGQQRVVPRRRVPRVALDPAHAGRGGAHRGGAAGRAGGEYF